MWSHIGVAQVPVTAPPDSWLAWAGGILNRAIFNGPAAVIVFFVISGFCIHYPNIGKKTLRLSPYYARRFLRILPPIIVALLLGGVVGARGLRVALDSWQLPTILWSLVAELIYYAVYPALRKAARSTGWPSLLAAAYGVASLLMLIHPGIKGMQDYGYSLTWLVGLPMWLLGCILAEQVAEGKGASIGNGRLWLARGGMLLLSILSWQSLYRKTGFLPDNIFVISLQVFGVATFFWLRAEIRHFAESPPPRLLEWCGCWSYSLYLAHELCQTLWLRLTGSDPGVFGGFMVGNLLRLWFVLALCLAFYFVVEAPSHRLARAAGRRLGEPA